MYKFEVGDEVEIILLHEDQESGEAYLNEVASVVAVDMNWEYPYELRLHDYELEKERKGDGFDLWRGDQLIPWEPVTMKLYKVTNGFQGYSEVFVLVVAQNPHQAKSMARLKFKAEAEDTTKYSSAVYTESYYNNLTVEELCSDTSKKWCGELSE